ARGEQEVGGCVGTDREVEAAAEGARRALEHALPARAAVGAAPDAGGGGGVDAVRAVRAHHQVVDVVEIGVGGGREPGPGLAGVGGLEAPGAAHAVDVEVALAGAGVEHVGVAGRHRQAVDGDVGQHVGDRPPALAGVVRLPDAAGDAAGEHDVG